MVPAAALVATGALIALTQPTESARATPNQESSHPMQTVNRAGTRPKPQEADLQLRSATPTLDTLPPPKRLLGGVGKTELLQESPPRPVNKLGYLADSQQKRPPEKVVYVAPDSLAFRAGLAVGDKILARGVRGTIADLIVERAGKRYLCRIDVASLIQQSRRDPLKAGIERTAAQKLHERSLVFMIDKSASMDTRDCPGGLSRWQWCKQHIGEIYLADNGLLANDISIVTFDSQFRSFRNCSAGQLSTVFQDIAPDGETNMAQALQESLDLLRRPLESGKPALIAIISDGRPTDAENLKKVIIDRVNSLSDPKLLSIVFIEVGTPEKYLKELDTELVPKGAKADVVTVMPMERAQKDGWTATLAAAVPKEDKPAEKNAARDALSGHVSNYNGSTFVNNVRPAPPVKAHPTGTAPGTTAAGTANQTGDPNRKNPQSTGNSSGSGAANKLVKPAPPVKAHPTGVNPETLGATAKPIEVDEKETTLRRNANKTYQ
ncbi:MAG: VWA domain-containing protein [Candidatus Obscuribacterales bacterium]|nr:VWA domain-containing protein [Candidatus Obscuribacterales bacterium]